MDVVWRCWIQKWVKASLVLGEVTSPVILKLQVFCLATWTIRSNLKWDDHPVSNHQPVKLMSGDPCRPFDHLQTCFRQNGIPSDIFSDIRIRSSTREMTCWWVLHYLLHYSMNWIQSHAEMKTLHSSMHMLCMHSLSSFNGIWACHSQSFLDMIVQCNVLLLLSCWLFQCDCWWKKSVSWKLHNTCTLISEWFFDLTNGFLPKKRTPQIHCPWSFCSFQPQHVWGLKMGGLIALTLPQRCVADVSQS